MNLSVGIVGLPNAGKSTLFNALCSRRLAETDIRPFTTINPHEAVVAVGDENLNRLCKLVNPEKCVPASVTFIDIAGLVKDAHVGAGLGNQFLGKIREVDAVVHVVRFFDDQQVTHLPGKIDPIEDIEIVNLELELAGITQKNVIYLLNTSEGQINTSQVEEITRLISDKFKSDVLAMPVKLEEELIDLSKEERGEYLKQSGLMTTGLNRLIKSAYQLLDLITFYTIKGGKEVHAWSIEKGAAGVEAAGKVHEDMAKGFIKAEVINVEEFIKIGSWKRAHEEGKITLVGRDYTIADGDVIEFKFNK